MTPPAKRALLSLKSMGVMCVSFAMFVWVNNLERSSYLTLPGGNPLSQSIVLKESRSGSPWTYRTVGAWTELDCTGGTVTMHEVWPGSFVEVETSSFLLDVAVGLVLSTLIALASERFLFSRMRGPRPTRATGTP